VAAVTTTFDRVPAASDTRGAVLVEFALVLPVMLVIFAGIFDFGMAFQRYQTVTNAAREGARMAILPGYTTADVQNRVSDYLAAGGVSGTPTTTVDPVTITPETGASFSAKQVTVKVDYVFSILGPIATLVGGRFGTISLGSTSVMRVEVQSGG